MAPTPHSRGVVCHGDQHIVAHSLTISLGEACSQGIGLLPKIFLEKGGELMTDTYEQALTARIVLDTSDGWFISIDELPGCMTCADTFWETLEMIQDAMCSWLEIQVEDGDAEEWQVELLTRLLAEPSKKELEDMAV